MKPALIYAVLLFKIIKDYWDGICPEFIIPIELKEKNIFLFWQHLMFLQVTPLSYIFDVIYFKNY